MSAVNRGLLPAPALLQRYADADGCYTDCFFVDVDGEISLAEFVGAFYVTWLFKVERFILAALVARPSTDEDVRELVEGDCEKFAAWSVEDRARDQLLMCDFQNRTRSWFMVAPHPQSRTRLYFGSAVTPAPRAGGAHDAPPTLGFAFQSLLGFHQAYSRALLAAARSRLTRSSLNRKARSRP
jgi:hypothetical protein